MMVRADGYYVDATAGRGGHVAALLGHLGPDGHILAIDRDPAAVAAVQARFAGDDRVEVRAGRFSTLSRQLPATCCIDGILFDFGVSSPQLDDAARGFSFLRDGPLDMRMDPTAGESAADWLNRAEEGEIRQVLWRYGEERHAPRIARAIVQHRAGEPLATTGQLAQLIDRAVPRKGREPGKHPATRSFQAIRIHINGELDEIEQVLPLALERLCSGGRLVAISFHSLEDRLVKRFLRDAARGNEPPPGVPFREAERRRGLRLIGKPIRPAATEVATNPRARSAIMRVAERLPTGSGDK